MTRLTRAALMPYKMESQSCKNLALSLSSLLKLKVVRLSIDRSGSAYVPNANKLVINWGNSKMIDWEGATPPVIWNKAPNIGNASNKLTAFNLFREAGLPNLLDYTTDYDTAVTWVGEGKVVVCRTQLNGHSGAGIVMAARPEDVVQGCPLFVVYKKKKSEFRVHVAFGVVIDEQQKRQRKDYDGTVDYGVRNHHTGWVYTRGEIVPDDRRAVVAVAAVAALGLDFGAVDIIYNEHEDRYYTLEVNTAPGLEGATVESYANAFAKEFTNAGR